nr:hypothetical protein [uncultured Cohaesibacter sp.]
MSLSSLFIYVLYHMQQALRFLFGNKKALDQMDTSSRGFLLSFLAFFLFQAAYILYALLFDLTSRTILFWQEGFFYYWRGMFAEWLYPIAILLLISLSKKYKQRRDRLIIAHNWTVGFVKFPLAIALSIDPSFSYGEETKLVVTMLFVIIGGAMLIRFYLAAFHTKSLLFSIFMAVAVMGGSYYTYDHFYNFGSNLSYAEQLGIV